MLKNYHAPQGTRLCIDTGDARHEEDLYSPAGLAMLSNLWIKAAAQHKINYEPTWLGRPVIQFAGDMVAIQEILWRVRPEIVVETGIAHGGSLVFSASMLELIAQAGGPDGQVIGIDIELRSHNRKALEEHPLAHRMDYLDGSSIDPQIVAQVAGRCAGKRTLVMLDSNHTQEHVRAEMDAYAPLVAEGSYLIVHDGAQAWVPEIPNGKPEWANNHPLNAIEGFLAEHPEFTVDEAATRFLITSSPQGYLRRRAPGEENGNHKEQTS